MNANPYEKKYHLADKCDDRGNVSPFCADKPRKINLARESWTLRWEAVTCKKCLARKPEGATDIYDTPRPQAQPA